MSDNYIDLPVEGGGPGAGVSSLNGLTGALVLVGSPHISITPTGPNALTISASGFIESINGDTTPAQTLSVGTAGTDFAIADAGGGSHVFNLPTASAVNRGALSSADWSTFNSKQTTLTPGSISSTTTGVSIGSGANSTVGPNVTVDIQTATTLQPGLLSSADWNTFNSKQSAGSYITALTGDVTASGPGSAATTIANNAVTNAKSAQMASLTIKGNDTGGTANPSDLTVAQVKIMLSLVGSNSGDVTLAAVGAVPNANAASLSGQVLTLQPASASFPGVITTGTQTIAGAKTFSSALVGSSSITGQSLAVSGTAGAGKLNLISQSAAPSTPTSGISLYSDANSRLAWKGTNGFTRTFDGAANTADQIYVLSDFSGAVSVINPRKISRLFDDFLSDGGSSTVAGTLSWDVTKAGTGSSVLSGGYADVFNQAQGVCAPYTGTTATGRTCISLSINAMGLGYGAISYETRILIGTLSTVTDEFIVVFGFGDNFVAGSTNSNGVSFIYDRTTSTNWMTRTTAGGIATTTTTSTAVTTSWLHMGININAAGTSVDFLVNDVIVATHTTNIPGFLQEVTPYYKILKSAGTNGRAFGIDYMSLNINWTGTR